MASLRGSVFLETDLDQCISNQNTQTIVPQQMETNIKAEEDLESAIAQTANSFAVIKESLHNLLEKMRLNRSETPRKCPSRPEVLSEVVHCGSGSEPGMSEKPSQLPVMEDRFRNAVPWWSSESSCDFDSDDSGFQFDSHTPKYVVYDSGSSEADVLESDPSKECSFWDRKSVAGELGSFGSNLTTTVLYSADQCCCPCSSSKNPKLLRTISGPSIQTLQIAGPQTKYRAREVLTGKGQLKLALYINSGLLTIHVEKAKKLESKKSKLCNSYVRIEMFPKPTRKPNCRTLLVKNDNCPLFDQKFSFELASSNEKKRIFISVWHRDLYRRNSEFLGCMSFGIAHITKHPVRGWYRLMTEKLGKNKHFEVKSGGKFSSILRKVGIYSSSSKLSRPSSKENMAPVSTKYFSCQRRISPLGSIGSQQQSANSHISSHQHQHYHQYNHSRPAATQENGRKIRVRAQIEYWRKSTENQEEIQKRQSSQKCTRRAPMEDVLKSMENCEGRCYNPSIEENYPEVNATGSELCADMKYPNIDRIWFVDEVGGNC